MSTVKDGQSRFSLVVCDSHGRPQTRSVTKLFSTHYCGDAEAPEWILASKRIRLSQLLVCEGVNGFSS